MKPCTKCKITKAFSEFNKGSDRYGLHSYCKDCMHEDYRRRHPAHPEDCNCKPCLAKVNAKKGLKYCPKCDSWVPFEDFTKNSSTSNGFGGYCKGCAAANEAEIRKTAVDAWDHEMGCTCNVCTARASVDPDSKQCTNCDALKPREGFFADPAAIDGLRSWCIECCAAYQKREGRWHYRKREYNLDRERFWEMYNAQGGCCPTCREAVAEPDINVDHDHRCCPGRTSCGKCIRGLLCRNCNVALGQIKDSAATAASMENYLLQWEDTFQLTPAEDPAK